MALSVSQMVQNAKLTLTDSLYYNGLRSLSVEILVFKIYTHIPCSFI